MASLKIRGKPISFLVDTGATRSVLTQPLSQASPYSTKIQEVTGRKQQYTWTQLPQGFKNSPTLFGAALARDLEALEIPYPEVGLQYVDDLLDTGQMENDCWQNTYALLHLLQELGYKASRKKAQLVLQKVRYLGYDIEPGKRTLGHERKKAICQLLVPRNRKDLRGFLGAAGFCHIWIPNFSLIAKPLYEVIR